MILSYADTRIHRAVNKQDGKFSAIKFRALLFNAFREKPYGYYYAYFLRARKSPPPFDEGFYRVKKKKLGKKENNCNTTTIIDRFS